MVLNFINWNVAPEIFSFGGFEIRWYGLLFASAFMFSYYIIQNIFKREGISEEVLDKLTIYVGLGTILGARLGHVLFYQPDYYLQHPLEVLQIWKGGLASHGAALGILIALWFFSRVAKRSYLWILDRIVIVVALSGALIRLGNLINSEIYGGQTTLPWGVKFIQNYPQGTPLDLIPANHPTQIYESISLFLVFALLAFLYYKKDAGKKPGLLFSLFLIPVFVFRFLIEFIKNTQVGFEEEMVINMGQILSIPFVLVGIFILFKLFMPVLKSNNS